MATGHKCVFCEKSPDDFEGIEFASYSPGEVTDRRASPACVCWDCLSSLMLGAAIAKGEWFDAAVDAANRGRSI